MTCLDCGSAATVEGKVRCGPCRERFVAKRDAVKRVRAAGPSPEMLRRNEEARQAYEGFMVSAGRLEFLSGFADGPEGVIQARMASRYADAALRYARAAFERAGVVVEI